MTEKNLKKLGFKKTNVSAKESGAEAFYYYIYEFSNSDLCLITSADDEVESKKDWVVYSFEENKLRFNDKSDVKKYIKLVTKNLIK